VKTIKFEESVFRLWVQIMYEVIECEVCGSNELIMVHDLGNHPLCDDLIPIGSDEKCHEYPIEILFCDICKTAHQRFQVPKKKLFPKSYHYRARMTSSVLQGMKDLVLSCKTKIGSLEKKVVLDIGCNDGSLLDFFKEEKCITIGIEPTDAAFDSKHETINSFFDAASVEAVLETVGEPDLITFTNVFAHIEDLNGMLLLLKRLIKADTVLVIENHYLGAVLNFCQFDTYYHEHPRTYSLQSFVYIAQKLGLNLINYEFVSRYGGNIRAYIGNGLSAKIEDIDESLFLQKFSQVNIDLLNWKWKTLKRIDDLVLKYGPLRAKAFPGRAAILVKLLGLNNDHISGVYEIKGSIKVNNYVPGTRIPILPEAQLYEEEDKSLPILNLAWHLPNEVRSNLAVNGYKGAVIDIKDFS